LKYTLQQAREAIRQNPELTREMLLSYDEIKAFTNAKEYTSDGVVEVLKCTKHRGAMILKSLERKGYLVKLSSTRAFYGRLVE